jgi:hypothetical protein
MSGKVSGSDSPMKPDKSEDPSALKVVKTILLEWAVNTALGFLVVGLIFGGGVFAANGFTDPMFALAVGVLTGLFGAVIGSKLKVIGLTKR